MTGAVVKVDGCFSQGHFSDGPTGNSFALFTNNYAGTGGTVPTQCVRIGLDGASAAHTIAVFMFHPLKRHIRKSEPCLVALLILSSAIDMGLSPMLAGLIFV